MSPSSNVLGMPTSSCSVCHHHWRTRRDRHTPGGHPARSLRHWNVAGCFGAALARSYNVRMSHTERKANRLPEFDYRTPGAYFVTVCVQDRLCLFGAMKDDAMHLNPAGEMIRQVWAEMPAHYAGIDIDAFVVMPNHVHGILWVRDPSGDDHPPSAGTGDIEGKESQDEEMPSGLSLPDAMHRFKSLTTARYRHGVTGQGWQRFHKVPVAAQLLRPRDP